MRTVSKRGHGPNAVLLSLPVLLDRRLYRLALQRRGEFAVQLIRIATVEAFERLALDTVLRDDVRNGRIERIARAHNDIAILREQIALHNLNHRVR